VRVSATWGNLHEIRGLFPIFPPISSVLPSTVKGINYVDVQVPILMRMYKKRANGNKAIGYLISDRF